MTFNRPISPHLTIYNVDLLTVFSIMHRITGVALSAIILITTVLLKTFSYGISVYCVYSLAYVLNSGFSFLFLCIGLVIIYMTVYHLTTGIRHLIWDTGSFLELEDMKMSAYIVLGVTLSLTLIMLFLIYI